MDKLDFSQWEEEAGELQGVQREQRHTGRGHMAPQGAMGMEHRVHLWGEAGDKGREKGKCQKEEPVSHIKKSRLHLMCWEVLEQKYQKQQTKRKQQKTDFWLTIFSYQTCMQFLLQVCVYGQEIL